MAWSTERQKRQWELRQTLGSVTGLPYWNRSVLLRLAHVGISHSLGVDIAAAMQALDRQLAKAEQELRYQLKHIPPNPSK